MQSNGILRSTDFEELLKRHPTERGICNLDLFVWEWTLRVFNEHNDGSVPISSIIIYLLLLLHDFCQVCHYMSFIYVIRIHMWHLFVMFFCNFQSYIMRIISMYDKSFVRSGTSNRH